MPLKHGAKQRWDHCARNLPPALVRPPRSRRLRGRQRLCRPSPPAQRGALQRRAARRGQTDLPAASVVVKEEETEFRSLVSRLFLENRLPGNGINSVVRAPTRAGARGLQDLVEYCAPSNANRDFLWALLHGSDNPTLDGATIPAQCKEDTERTDI